MVFATVAGVPRRSPVLGATGLLSAREEVGGITTTRGAPLCDPCPVEAGEIPGMTGFVESDDAQQRHCLCGPHEQGGAAGGDGRPQQSCARSGALHPPRRRPDDARNDSRAARRCRNGSHLRNRRRRRGPQWCADQHFGFRSRRDRGKHRCHRRGRGSRDRRQTRLGPSAVGSVRANVLGELGCREHPTSNESRQDAKHDASPHSIRDTGRDDGANKDDLAADNSAAARPRPCTHERLPSSVGEPATHSPRTRPFGL